MLSKNILHGDSPHIKKDSVCSFPWNRQERTDGIARLLKSLQCFRLVKHIPPRRIVLQPFGKPGKYRILPTDALAVIEDMMVLSFHQHHCRFTPQQFQSRKHLDALAYRHVRIDGPMQEKQRSVYFFRIEQRTMVDKQLLVLPRITVGCRNFAI